MVEPNFEQSRKQILNLLRWKLTDPAGRGSTATTTGTGDGSTTAYTLGNNGVKYVGTTTIASVEKDIYEDFTVDFKDTSSAAVVTFLTAPASGAAVSIAYGYGNTWIYPDTPRVDAAMPRIGVNLVTGSMPPSSLGGTANWYRPIYEVSIWVRMDKTYTISSRKYTGNELRDYLASKVQEAILDNINILDDVIYAELVGFRNLDHPDNKLRSAHLDFAFQYDWRRT